MPFLPIAQRELLVAARRRSTYRMRFWAVLAASVVFAWRCVHMLHVKTSSAAQGNELFLTLFVLAFTFALFIGAQTTSDCLSVEKREGTMGLLFLTDLKGYDIVVGKLVASSVAAVYGLLAIVPTLAVPILLGGVSMTSFLHAIIAIGSVLLLSLSAGMLASVYNRNERKAAFYTILVMLLVVFGPLLIGFVAEENRWFADPRELWMIFCASPGFMILQIFGGNPWIPAEAFWISSAITCGLAFIFLTRVAARLPVSWQEKGDTKRNSNAAVNRSLKLARMRARLLDINPFLWLSFRSGNKKNYAWLFVGAMVLIWSSGFLSDSIVMYDSIVIVPLILTLNGFFKIWIVTEACQQLIEARRSGALELLLSTPLTDRDIIRGQWFALRQQFALPLMLSGILELTLIFIGKEHRWFYSAWVLSIPMDFIALGWAGMWLGLTAKNTTRAIMQAAVLILILPWLTFYLCGLLIEFILPYPIPQAIHRMTMPMIELGVTSFWLFLGAAAAYFVGLHWARKNVLQKFRLIATEQYQLKKND